VENDFEYQEMFRRKFRNVFHEIDMIKMKVHKKNGFIFKRHIYTVEELLDSKHHAKIYAITEKIGSDALNWFNNGNLSQRAIDIYHKERDRIDDKLEFVNEEIMQRNPTWWENIRGVLVTFIEFVMDNMPILIQNSLEWKSNQNKFLERD